MRAPGRWWWGGAATATAAGPGLALSPPPPPPPPRAAEVPRGVGGGGAARHERVSGAAPRVRGGGGGRTRRGGRREQRRAFPPPPAQIRGRSRVSISVSRCFQRPEKVPPLGQRIGARGREPVCGSRSRAWPGPLAGEEAGGGGACQGAGEGSCAEAKWGAR